MLMTIETEKNIFRKKIIDVLKHQSESVRLEKSHSITQSVLRDEQYISSKHVMIYVSTAYEVQTKDLIEESLYRGKRVSVPYVDQDQKRVIAVEIHNHERDLKPGAYGILEPVPEIVKNHNVKDMELIFVPGFAFDKSGHRLGRGKGYYDRFLSEVSSNTKTYGLAFDIQVFDSIPHDENDVALERVIMN